MKLVHWPLMGVRLHLVQRGGDWAGPQPAPPRPLLAVPNVTGRQSTASVPITVLLYNGPLLSGFNVPIKGLKDTVIMSYLKSIEIILLLIALFIAIAPDKRVICISVVFKNSIGQKSIQYVGSVLWNEIPQLLNNPMSKYTFKRKLKAHLLNEQAIF